MSGAESTSQDSGAHEAGSLLVERKSLTLREKTADVLRQAIVEQRFPPGAHLVERELCDLLGVSRTSVREALRHLESEHLIRMVPHKGPVVTSLTAKDAQDIYQVRASLEGLAGQLFASNATDEQIRQLRETAQEMAEAAEDSPPNVVLEIVARFYRILFAGSQNEICEQIIQSLNTRIFLLRRMSISSAGRRATMMREVERIVQAAVARDPEALKSACIAHVDGACAAAIGQLAANEVEEASGD